jgi:hypothetical protein
VKLLEFVDKVQSFNTSNMVKVAKMSKICPGLTPLWDEGEAALCV